MINGQPYLDLDKPLDVEGFFRLKPELDRCVQEAVQRPGIDVGDYISVRLPESYGEKHLPDRCFYQPAAKLLPGFLKFVKSLPFVQVGRILIMPNQSSLHTDPQREWHDHFVWMQVGFKGFYVMKPNKEKVYVKSTFAWFDHNDYHGSDLVDASSYSIRVDGVFSVRFMEEIGVDLLPRVPELL